MGVECSGVGVGEQPGALQHHLRGVGDVVDGRFVPAGREPARGLVVAKFRSFAEGEERLGTPGVPPGLRHGHHLVEAHERCGDVRRRLRERAVPTTVATELGEGDEDLGRVGDHVAEGLTGALVRAHRQLIERRGEEFRSGGGPSQRRHCVILGRDLETWNRLRVTIRVFTADPASSVRRS